MIAAPLVGWLGDRFPRRNIVVFGIVIWSGFTLLTWFAHDYGQLLFRHTIVGVGEASYATIAPALIADAFPRTAGDACSPFSMWACRSVRQPAI